MCFNREVLIINNLTLLSVILLFVVISNAIVVTVLKKKIGMNVINLISNIIILPAIPLLWLISRGFDLGANTFTSFYLPLIVTIFIIGMLIFRIIKYIKD